MVHGLSFFAAIFTYVYLAIPLLIVLIVWQVVSALNRTSRAVEDIAQSLRRLESRELHPTPPA